MKRISRRTFLVGTAGAMGTVLIGCGGSVSSATTRSVLDRTIAEYGAGNVELEGDMVVRVGTLQGNPNLDEGLVFLVNDQFPPRELKDLRSARQYQVLDSDQIRWEIRRNDGR